MTSKKLESKSEKEAVSLVEVSVNDVMDVVEATYLAFLDDVEGMPSVLLLGKAGIGKTVSVYLLARRLSEKLGREFIDLRTSQGRDKIADVFKEPSKYFIFYSFAVTHVEPTDLSGVLRASQDNGYATYLPPEYVKLFSLDGVAGVVFLDEVTTDNRIDRRSSEMKILDEKQFGYITLSSKVMVITAGNTEEDTSLATPLPDPILRGRVMIFRVGSPTVDDWLYFMNNRYGFAWEKKVGAFLKKWSGLLWKVYDSDEGYTPRNSPRSWTKLARVLYLTKGLSEGKLEMLVSSLVDSQSATLLMTFLRTSVPDLEDLKLNLKMWEEMSIEAKYIIVSMLASRKPDEIVERFSELLDVVASDSEMLELLRSLMSEKQRMEFISLVRKRKPTVFKKMWDSFKSSINFGLE